MSAPLSEDEWKRLCWLGGQARLGVQLNTNELAEWDSLAARGKIRRPNVPPPTIGIPVVRPWDMIAQSEGGNAPVA